MRLIGGDTTDTDKISISHLDSSSRASRDPRKILETRARRSLVPKERSVSVRPIPRIFEPVSPFGYISVFDGIGRHCINDKSKTDCFPSLLL